MSISSRANKQIKGLFFQKCKLEKLDAEDLVAVLLTVMAAITFADVSSANGVN